MENLRHLLAEEPTPGKFSFATEGKPSKLVFGNFP
jgi:hypothetical protein